MKSLKALAGLAAMAMMVGTALAAPGSLYLQEGTVNDGTPSINAAGMGPAGDAGSTTNWKYQTGSASWSGIYAGNGWLDIAEVGDASVEVEADIEMFVATTISNNKVYFHLGNLYSATPADKTAIIDGTLVSNEGMFVGISFAGTDKTAADFEMVGTEYTGKVLGGMVSDVFSYGNQALPKPTMDIRFLMSWGAGYRVPDNYGDGAHSTIHDTLWWEVNDDIAGAYNLQWKVELLPAAHQADGDYYLDPAIVTTPAL